MAKKNSIVEADRIARKRSAERSFFAIVSSVSGGLVNIKRLGHSTIEGPYAAQTGIAAGLVADDKVVCREIGGVVVVEYELATS